MVELSERNQLFLNVNRTTEMTDCRRKWVAIPPLSILGQNANVEQENKYLVIHTDNRLNWKTKVEAVYKKIH